MGSIVVRADTAQYSCTIGGQKFSVLAFNGYEEMSRLYRYNLTLWSENPKVDIKSLIRKDAEIRINWDEQDPKEKTFFGIVASMSQLTGNKPEVEEDYGHYSCEVVPTLWILGQQSNCWMFQNLTTMAIVDAVLNARGMAGKFEWKLTQGTQMHEYQVQYRETDLAFISRMLEEEGIYYWFEHHGKEMMIIGDSPSAYGDCWPETIVRYQKGTGALPTPESKDLEYISDLVYQENAHTGSVMYRDWNYRDPQKPPEEPGAEARDNADIKIYDYHLERYLSPGYGSKLARMALESQSGMCKTISGSGTWRSITCGSVFTIKEAYRSDLNRSWVVVSASHAASQQAHTGVDYTVSFTAIPEETTFRPLPRSPAPSLNMQTATVVGPPGAEIYMDDYGRAKVQFHWDREHDYGPDASCWIRVMEPYAGRQESTGKKHGFQWHPLIDDEVVVDFLEGDPANPIIVGSVYNFQKIQPLKPEELISNVILTRYQHRLLFDDKNQAITLNTPYPHTLKLDDPAKKATLTTKYDHQLEMWDPHQDNKQVPNVKLKTGGSEVINMEDKQPDFGNNIKISTADGHQQHFADGPSAQGIKLQTKENNYTNLNDKDRNIEAQTTDGHRVIMDDANKTIVVTSKDKHRIEVSDQAKFIEVADASGEHFVKIDIGGKKITISTQSGDIDVLAPSGNIKLAGKTIEILGQKSVDIKSQKIHEGAGVSLKMESPQVETKGGTVKSTAATLHTIKGLPVKIN